MCNILRNILNYTYLCENKNKYNTLVYNQSKRQVIDTLSHLCHMTHHEKYTLLAK